MKEADDWEFILNTVDGLFYRLSTGIISRTGLSLEDAHEEAWVLFEQGRFRLQCGDDDSVVGVVACETDNERRSARKQNKRLADYRQNVIEEAVERAVVRVGKKEESTDDQSS